MQIVNTELHNMVRAKLESEQNTDAEWRESKWQLYGHVFFNKSVE